MGDAYKIAILAGDAIGPEIMAQAVRVLTRLAVIGTLSSNSSRRLSVPMLILAMAKAFRMKPKPFAMQPMQS